MKGSHQAGLPDYPIEDLQRPVAEARKNLAGDEEIAPRPEAGEEHENRHQTEEDGDQATPVIRPARQANQADQQGQDCHRQQGQPAGFAPDKESRGPSQYDQRAQLHRAEDGLYRLIKNDAAHKGNQDIVVDDAPHIDVLGQERLECHRA